MPIPKKWMERIVGESSDSYLVTTTNFEEHSERAPEWLPKASVSTENKLNWQTLRHAIEEGLSAMQHETYSPHVGDNQVAVYADGDLFAYIDTLPLAMPMRTALGGKYSKTKVRYYAHSRFFASAPPACTAAVHDLPLVLLPATQKCRDPANLDIAHQDTFHCTSARHHHNLVSCRACSEHAVRQAIEAGKNDIIQHGANLPLCFNCASAHVEIGKLCTCLQNKCVQCVRETVANMEKQKLEMDYATNFGEWCLDCLSDVNGFHEVNKCVLCGGVVLLPT